MKNSKKKSYCGDNKKGFTLVELIVVLVILAILAAVLVPALLGYIDKAKQKRIILHGSYDYKGAQSVAAEKYGQGAWNGAVTDPNVDTDLHDQIISEAEILVETPENGEIYELTFSAPGLISTTEEKPFRYKEDGLIAKLVDGVWTIEEEEGESGGGAEETPTPQPGGGSGQTGVIPDTTQDANSGFTFDPSLTGDNTNIVLNFFANGQTNTTPWQGLTVNGTAVKMVSFTGKNGKDTYYLVLGNTAGADEAAVKQSIVSHYNISDPGNVLVSLNGTLTAGNGQNNVLTQLSNTLGLSNGGKIESVAFNDQNQITDIQFNGNKN